MCCASAAKPRSSDLTSEEGRLLNTFLQDFVRGREEGFCRKLPEGHGVRAIALRSTTNVVDTLKSIIEIRQACLAALYPDEPSRELLLRELDTDESTACYDCMFEQWLDDDSHWREEQGAIYKRRAHYWKTVNTYAARLRREASRAWVPSSRLIMAA